MCQYLPTGEFRFVPLREVDMEEILATSATAEYGYFLEVDLSYPEFDPNNPGVSLHDYLDEFPPGPENKIPRNHSPYQRSLIAEDILQKRPELSPEALETEVDNVLKRKNGKKLIASLEKKTKHICHYRLLQKYLELGMQLDKVHRVVKFRQGPWMKPYIDFNSKQRAEATSEFEKEFYKLMNNR